MTTFSLNMLKTLTLQGVQSYFVNYICRKDSILKLVFALILITLVPIFTSAQEITIMSWEGEPIADVYIIAKEKTYRSNAHGKVNLQKIEDNLTYQFQHPNFRRKHKSGQQIKDKKYTVVLFEKDIYIDEIKVKALKREQLRDLVPGRVIPIQPALFEKFNPQTTADLVGESGEVFIQKSQMGGGSPMIRGFSANRILLVFDGVRMNNAIYRSGNLHNIISIDPQSLGQVDVIMGPGSVMYGSDALGGVLSFQPLQPKLSTSEVKTQFNSMARFSSANFERTMHVDFNVGGKKFANYTSVTFSSFDHLTMGSKKNDEYLRNEYVSTLNGFDEIIINPNPQKQVFTGYDQMNIFSKFRFHPNDFWDLSYSFTYSSTSNIPRYDRLIQYSGNQLKYAQWYYGPQNWIMHNFQANYIRSNTIFDKAKLIIAYQNYKESRHSRSFGSTSFKRRYENVDALSINLDFDKKITKKTDIFYGAEGLFNYVGSAGLEEDTEALTMTDYAPRYPDGSKWWSASFYTMLNHHISTRSELQGGLRYNIGGMDGTFSEDYYNFPFSDFSNFNQSITGSIGYAVNKTDFTRYNVSISSGYRAPNIDDVAKVFDSEPGTVIVPNPNLQPEYALTTEAGIWIKPAKRTQIELSAYYTRLFNAMVRRSYTLNGLDSMLYDGEMSKIEALVNASGANIYGASLRTEIELYDWLNVSGTINWQQGKDDDGFAMRHIAPLFGNVHLKLNRGKLELDLYSHLNGEIKYENLAPDEQSKPHMYATDNNGNPYSPSWATLNLGVSYKFSRYLKLNGEIENIADLRYRPYSSGMVAPGRNLVISVIMNLK